MKRIYEKDGVNGTITERCNDIKGARVVAWCFKRVMPHSKIHVRRGHIVVAVCKNSVDFWSGAQLATQIENRMREQHRETKIQEGKK